jgi:uncharacterized protein YaeQ
MMARMRLIPEDTEDADRIVVLNQKCLSIVLTASQNVAVRIWWRVEEKTPAVLRHSHEMTCVVNLLPLLCT